MNIEETLLQLKRKIDTINTKRIENKTKLEALENEKSKLLQECTVLGVDPTQLENIVTSEETKLNDEIQRFYAEVETIYNELAKF